VKKLELTKAQAWAAAHALGNMLASDTHGRIQFFGSVQGVMAAERAESKLREYYIAKIERVNNGQSRNCKN
jgi:hypothetical protein